VNPPPPPPPVEFEPGIVLSATSTQTTVTANVVYGTEDRKAAVGKNVEFILAYGTTTPLTASATTDDNGRASVTFTGLRPSTTYTVYAYDADDDDVDAEREVTTLKEEETGGSSSSGCNTGFAALGLLAVPFFLRKRD
jgi:Synergist-CTERM protein sorting domain-containing protein